MRTRKPIRSDMGWSTSDRIVVCGLDLPKEILGKVSLGEVRDMFKTSRKYAQALLEYLDSKKITRRVGDERVLF